MNFFQKFLLKFTNMLYPSKIYGIENISDSNTIICSNHLSMIDAVYLRRLFKNDTHFVAKKEVVEKKIIGKLLVSFGAVPVDRDNVDIRSLMAITKIIKSGKNLVIFPEGTRNKTGDTTLAPFKGGPMVFAVKCKKPILPVVIYKKAKLFRKNYIFFGKPFELKEFYEEDLDEQTISAMANCVRDKMIEIQNQLNEIISSKSRKNRKNRK